MRNPPPLQTATTFCLTLGWLLFATSFATTFAAPASAPLRLTPAEFLSYAPNLQRSIEMIEGATLRLTAGDAIPLGRLPLDGYTHVTCRLAPLQPGAWKLELRQGTTHGPVAASENIFPIGAAGHPYGEFTTPLKLSPTPTNLFLVASSGDPKKQPTNAILSLAWVEFRNGPTPAHPPLRTGSRPPTRILIIPTRIDHPWRTHMYTQITELLARELNQIPGIQAVVSPDLDWPSDPAVLQGVKSIVYYSRPAGDILLAPARKAQVRALLDAGVGFTALHWATGAPAGNGDEYINIAGGCWIPPQSGIKIAESPLTVLAADHAILRDWKPAPIMDEFYLNQRIHPAAQPLLKVSVDGKDHVVAWTLLRPDQGRSFGCTLGHFQENWYRPLLSQLVLNGILWTAHAR